jgi:predicted GNAT family acetyltransferase
MKTYPVLPHSTGLDARFDAELAAVIPGWRSEFECGDGCVQHNAAEKRFEIRIADRLAVVDYRMLDGRMVLTHTFVPPELRGQKIAERLVAAALNYAREQGLRVVPQCSYVDVFLRRHKEFAGLRA